MLRRNGNQVVAISRNKRQCVLIEKRRDDIGKNTTKEERNKKWYGDAPKTKGAVPEQEQPLFHTVAISTILTATPYGLDEYDRGNRPQELSPQAHLPL